MIVHLAAIIAATVSGDVELGRHLYNVHCSSCHGQALQGSIRAPALINVDAAMVDFQLRTGRMPSQDVQEQQFHKPPQFPDDQIRAIEAYVASRSSGNRAIPSPSPVPSSVPTAVLVHGREVYEENCEHCHSAVGQGNGAVGYHDTAPEIVDDDPAAIVEAVREGPAVMPQFGNHVIDDKALADLTAYVNYLRVGHYDAGGEGLKDWGPVSEGFVAWLFGLGALVLFIRRVGET